MNFFQRERAMSDGWLAAVKGVSFSDNWRPETKQAFKHGCAFRRGYALGLAGEPAPFGDLQVRGWREGQRKRKSTTAAAGPTTTLDYGRDTPRPNPAAADFSRRSP